jgi:hypothetical protein
VRGRPGQTSVKEHRAWIALHDGWEPQEQRPDHTTVDHTMARLSHERGQPEAEIVRSLAMRMAFTPAERADVEQTVRQAIAVVVQAAHRVGRAGQPLTDNVLFDALARRWSPAYSKVTEPAGVIDHPHVAQGAGMTPSRERIVARMPSQMKPETLEAAQNDLACAGLRLGALFALARRDARNHGLYKPVKTDAGWRIRSTQKPKRAHRLLLADDPPLVREPEHRVTGEIVYEPVLSGPRSVAVMDALEETRLRLDGAAAREELTRMETTLRAAKEHFDHVKVPHAKVPRPGKSRYGKNYINDPPWSAAEIDALTAVREAEGPVRAFRHIVPLLPADGAVTIRTQMQQGPNRRWHAATFGVESTGDTGTRREMKFNDRADEVGEDDVVYYGGPQMRATRRRGRLFTAASRWVPTGEPLAGVDVVSSQYQILSILLGDTHLEAQLATRSAHKIAADAVWPGDDDGPARAKLITVPGGYGSTPHTISEDTGVPVDEVRKVLGALGPDVARFGRYVRRLAWAVDQYRGFEFTDPFEGSPVTWYPIRTMEARIATNNKGESYKLKTYVPRDGPLNAEGRAPVNRYKLQRQLAPMLVHTLDSAFNGFVVEHLRTLGVTNIVAINDCWFIPESEARAGKLEVAVRNAGKDWLESLSRVYDALLAHPVKPKKDMKWMTECKAQWAKRLAAKQWPVFRTKPVTLVDWWQTRSEDPDGESEGYEPDYEPGPADAK